MIRPVSFLLLVAALSRNVFASEGPSVVVAHSEPDLDSVARRIGAELRSAGHGDVFLERRTPLGTCTSRPARDDGAGQVGIVLRTEEGGIVTAEICANPQPNQVTLVTARGRLDEEGEFAIVVTEALHGLLIDPLPQERSGAEVQVQSDASNTPEESRLGQDDPAYAATSISAGARMVLDVPTGDYWAGVVPSIQVALSEKISFGAEFMLGVRPIAYSDELIELESHLAWAKMGLLGSQRLGPLRWGWDVSGGLYSNRATAEAVLPRVGGTDGTFGAIFGAGAFGEFPARGMVFGRGTLGISTLVPRLSYQLSEETTPDVGALLLEGGLALGIRFERAP